MSQFGQNLNDQDDFQFKPLTEGLGFHRKPDGGGIGAEAATRISQKATSFVPEMSSDLTGSLHINQPLPRKGFEQPAFKKSPTAPNTTVDDILKTLNNKRGLDFDSKKKLHEPTPTTYRRSHFDLSASLLDGMLVTSATLLCLIVLLMVTHVDLFANLYHPDSQMMIYLSLGALVAGITWIYLVCNRVFLGFTPGEWVFDQRLGKPEDMGSASYILKTVVRSTVVMATGLVVFPILSILLNRDVLGRFLGLELIKKV